MKIKTIKDGTNFLIVILNEYIVVEYYRERAEPDNTNILILKKQRRICMA
jgi:hypothetical protein